MFEVAQEMVNGVYRFANAVGLWINAANIKVLSAQVSPSRRSSTLERPSLRW